MDGRRGRGRGRGRGKRNNKDREINDSSRESTRRTAARTTGTYGGEDGARSADATASGALPAPIRGRDIAAQNAPRSAPVANQPTGHPVGQHQLAAAPGEIRPDSHPMGQQLPGLQAQAQGSGSKPPQLRVCPKCHNSVSANDGICLQCAVSNLLQHPLLPLPRLRRSQGLQEQEQWPPSPTYPTSIANRPTEQLLPGPPRPPLSTQDLLQGLQPPTQAQGSGSSQTQPGVCSVCHGSNFSNTLCLQCAGKFLSSSLPPPPPSPPRQQRPQGLQEQWPPSPTYPALIANRQTEQLLRGPPQAPPATAIQSLPPGLQPPPQAPAPRADEPVSTRGRGTPLMKQAMPLCPACRVNQGRAELLPWRHLCICSLCSFRGIACQVCIPAISGPPQPQDQRAPRPQQQAQPPSPVGAGAHQQQQQQKQKLHYMPELAAAIFPVGERDGVPGPGGLSAAQPVLLPELQQPSQAQPVPRDEKLVRFHQNPHGADPEDGRCPACLHYPARTVLQPRRHECLCSTCLDRFECRVCHPA